MSRKLGIECPGTSWGNDPEFEADRPALAHGQLDLRFQPAEWATPNSSARAGGVAVVSNSRLPIMVYAPEGVEVRYRV